MSDHVPGERTDLDGDDDKEWRNFFCTGYTNANLPPPTFNPVPPPDCIRTEPGDKIGQQRKDLHDRFEMPCTSNNWPDNPAEADIFFGPDGGGYGSDPRYVTLVVADDTAFQASGGRDDVSSRSSIFAGFYVTGWDYHPNETPQAVRTSMGHRAPYEGNDPHPIYGTGYNHSVDNGDVWGYFINTSSPSQAPEGSSERRPVRLHWRRSGRLHRRSCR